MAGFPCQDNSAGEVNGLPAWNGAGTRHSITRVLFKQCAWCGAIRIAGRFRLHNQVPILKWGTELRFFSWLVISMGVSHGVCGACASRVAGSVRVGQERRNGS